MIDTSKMKRPKPCPCCGNKEISITMDKFIPIYPATDEWSIVIRFGCFCGITLERNGWIMDELYNEMLKIWNRRKK
jgi:hypothetical protein